jgi:hypothetical protein
LRCDGTKVALKSRKVSFVKLARPVFTIPWPMSFRALLDGDNRHRMCISI